MSGMLLDNFRFFYEDVQGCRTLLADARDYAANGSRALLHYIDDDYVWVMRDNLKNITEYIERDTASASSLRAALAVLAVRELWGKYRPRRILWLGAYGRATTGVSKMLPIFHDENRLYAVSPDLPDAIEDNVVPIRAACNLCPLPEDYFDVVVTDMVESAPDRVTQTLLSLRVEGLFLCLLPTGRELPCAIPNRKVFSDDDGNSLVRVKLTRELAVAFRERSEKGRLFRQKRLVSYILDEVGDALGAILVSDDDMQLDAAIMQATLAEENLLPIYEELVSDDVKYLANRFKESLIEFRLHRSEATRARVFEEYFSLRREMRESDDF